MLRQALALSLALVVCSALTPGCGGKTSEWGQWIHTDSGPHPVGLETSAGAPCIAYFGGSRHASCVGFYSLYPSPAQCGFGDDDIPAERCEKVCGPDATCSVSPLSPGGVTCTSTLAKCTSCSITDGGHLSDGCARYFSLDPSLAACGFTAPLDAAACAAICGNATDTCSILSVDDGTTTVRCQKIDPLCPVH